MSDRPSSSGDGAQALRFACACTSAAPVAEDPWVAISQQRKLNDGTKELILNALYREPRTTAQLAQLLGLSAPAVHRHVVELLVSELIREVVGPKEGRRSALERYYRPNFPVVLAADRAVLQPALARTSLPARGDGFEALLHYLFAAAVRTARAQLEAAGELPAWPEHDD